MPIYIGNTKIADMQAVYLGQTEVKEVYLGNNKIWPIDFTVEISGATTSNNGVAVTFTATPAQASGTVTYSWNTGATTASITLSGSDTTLTGSVTATDASGATATDSRDVTFSPAPPPPPPPTVRNTYTGWSLDTTVDPNPYFTGTPTVTVTTGEWVTETTAPESQQYLNRSRTITTVSVGAQDQAQSRACTANGGCDGPYTRIISAGNVTDTTTETETEATSSLNPNYKVAFDPTNTAHVGITTAGVARNTGDVSTQNTESFVTAVLATGQVSSYDVIPFGDDAIPRTINVTISGTVPVGSIYSNGGTSFSQNLAIAVVQQPMQLLPPTVTATVFWQTTTFGFPSQTVGDGGTVALTSYDTSTQYRITLSGGTSQSGGGSFSDPGFFPGRSHTVSATNAAGTDEITFSVRK